MSYPIGKNINPYQYQQQVSMGVNGVNTPQLQELDAEAVRQNITQNSALKAVGSGSEEEKNKWLTPVLTVPVWGAMAYGMKKFNEACSGTEKGNLLYKVGQWGEKVGLSINAKTPKFLKTFFNKTKIAKENFMKWLVVPKHKIAYAFFKTPAEPVQNMTKMMAGGTINEIASDAVQKFEKYVQEGKELTLKGKKLTLKDVQELSKNSSTPEGIKKIIEICDAKPVGEFFQLEKTLKIPFTKKMQGGPKYLSDYIPKLADMNRKVYFSEIANKLKAFHSNNTTYLGKKLPKAMIRTIEGITNGTAGGKFAILMAAYFVADAIKKTIDAPKGHGEKRKTFAENMIYNVGWYLTMPLGLGIMYKSGGLKYLGMSPEKVKEYREKLAKFNEEVDKGILTDKVKYAARKKEIKSMLKGDINVLKTDSSGTKAAKILKNIIYKPLKFAANILDVGLERFRPILSKNGKSVGNFLKEAGYKIKGAAGYPIRFGLFMFAIAPFLGKLCAKGSHIVFGKPSKSVLDEDKEPEKNQIVTPVMPEQSNQVPVNTQAQLQPQVHPQQPIQPVVQNQNLSYSQNQQTQPVQNVVDMSQQDSLQRAATAAIQGVATRTYVPSTAGVVIDPSTFEEKNRNAKAAYDKAQKIEDATKKQYGY